MNCCIRRIIIVIGIGVLLGVPNYGTAQTTPRMTANSRGEAAPDTSQQKVPPQAEKQGDEEIELAEINIEAVIEKPSVSIISKRATAELDDMQFIDRSFEKELKRAPEKPMLFDDRLFAPQKIENLKQKLIEKKQQDKK